MRTEDRVMLVVQRKKKKNTNKTGYSGPYGPLPD